MSELLTIAIIGGTGAEGSGLAVRLAHAGHTVILGSRSAEKAATVAAELNQIAGGERIRGSANVAAAAAGSIVLLTVPFAGQMQTLREIAPQLAGKILVDVTVPLVPPKVNRVQLPAEGSCVAIAQRELGESVRVVSAFQNVSAHKLRKLDAKVECDVLVCADDSEARRTVMALIKAIGLRGINAGPLANSAAAEALTSVLIWINRTYKVPDAGIAITGLPRSEG
jgi:8-hydroxy-5-deazaflavin:NADPH oxidoreductase